EHEEKEEKTKVKEPKIVEEKIERKDEKRIKKKTKRKKRPKPTITLSSLEEELMKKVFHNVAMKRRPFIERLKLQIEIDKKAEEEREKKDREAVRKALLKSQDESIRTAYSSSETFYFPIKDKPFLSSRYNHEEKYIESQRKQVQFDLRDALRKN